MFYLKYLSDISVGRTVGTNDDLPALQVGDVRRHGQVEESEDVDSGRRRFHHQRLMADVVGGGGVVEKHHLLVQVDVTTFLQSVNRFNKSLNDLILNDLMGLRFM